MTGELICNVDACKADAVYTYVWAWGESGVCCAQHRVILEQKAKQLQRTISFSPVNAGATNRPLERDERIQLRATIMTLEEELQTLKGEAATRYHQFAELQTEHVRLREVYARIQEELDEAQKDRDGARALLADERAKTGELVRELEAVKRLVPRPEQSPPA